MSNKSWVGETFLGPTYSFLSLSLSLSFHFSCKTFRIYSFNARTAPFVLLPLLVYFFFLKYFCENMAPLLQARCKFRKSFNILFHSSWVCNRLRRISCHPHLRCCDPSIMIDVLRLKPRFVSRLTSVKYNASVPFMLRFLLSFFLYTGGHCGSPQEKRQNKTLLLAIILEIHCKIQVEILYEWELRVTNNTILI